MRSNAFKSLALVLLIGAGASPASGQVTNVIDWNSQWKYHQDGVLPAANWMATNYSDSAWPSGAGVLGFPQNENLVIGGVAVNTLLSQTAGGANIITYYFRTTFHLTTTNGVTLMASNLLDDGAVIYLNGREVARPGMAAGAVSNTTQAQRGGEISDATHGVDSYSIPISFAKVGTNVVAIEVHQNGTASSDMILGMRLVAEIPDPPTILVHPQDTTADAGTSAQFSVVASGTTPLTYRWYTNNVLVPNQSGATLTTPITSLSMNGIVYHVVVSNRFGMVTSSSAVLTVVQDRNGPVILSALATASNAVEIRFNETISPFSTTNNLSNYVVHLLGTTNTLTVTQAIWGISVARIRFQGSMNPSSNYVVCVYNIADQSGNIAFGDCIGITGPPAQLTNDVFSLGSAWRFADFITDDRMDRTNWTSLSFAEDPNDWAGPGAGIFWFDQVGFNPTCSGIGTEIINFPETQYFRRIFNLASSFGTGVTARVTYLADDAAVFYINGTEIFRTPNMAPGPVTYTTRPTAAGPENNCQVFAVTFNGDILRVGSNVFAVELHQVASEGANNDMVFDAGLQFLYRITPTIPALNVFRTYTTNLQGGIAATNSVVTWPGTGWVFQHALNPFGPWTNITSGIVSAGGTNRYSTIVPQQGPRRFYRLKNP